MTTYVTKKTHKQEFVTKDSGKRIKMKTGAVRDVQ